MVPALLKANTGNKMDRLKNLMQREGYAGVLKKSTSYTGLKGKPKHRVEGSSEYGLYYDSLGKLTGGVGDLIESEEEANKYRNISKQEAIRILQEETIPSHDESTKALLKRQKIDASSLSESQLNAIKDVVFQLGSNADDKFPEMFKAIKEGDYEKASYEAAHNSSGGPSAWMQQTATRVKDFQKRINMKAAKKQMKKQAEYKITDEQLKETKEKTKGKSYREFADEVSKFIEKE
jgi:hypothetical protein